MTKKKADYAEIVVLASDSGATNYASNDARLHFYMERYLTRGVTTEVLSVLYPYGYDHMYGDADNGDRTAWGGPFGSIVWGSAITNDYLLHLAGYDIAQHAWEGTKDLLEEEGIDTKELEKRWASETLT